jgi:hypothetical protein
MWHFINSFEAIPNDRDLVLGVANTVGMHELAFPCQRGDGVWLDSRTRRPVEVHPTHWREWQSD